jgi:hypothetical protein
MAATDTHAKIELLEAVCSALSMPRQRLQNKVLHTTGNFPMRTPVLDLHTAFNLLCVHEYITKLYRQKSYKIMRMNMFAKPDIENIRGLNLAVVKLTTVQVTKLPL